ncbi:MAG: tetratricopeptide repeat protein, partial [Rhodobacter sp.]|nr:tetratricopeptide repeat protein [Rhodobacter sp.]
MQEAVEADTRGDLAAARQLYYRALLDLPDDPQIWINLGALFRSQKNFALSLAAQSKAFALDPDNLATCTNLANILDDVGDHGRAVVLRGKLAGARPDDPDSFALLIRSMRAAGQLDLAEQTATSALQRFPDHPKIRFELGFQFLAQRRYAEGFLHYLTRRATGQVRLPDTEIPRWTGADPQGKRILVLPEQGFGDTINFCRFLPFLKARGATVHLLTRPAAHRRKLRVGCVWTGSEGYDRNDMRSFPHT